MKQYQQVKHEMYIYIYTLNVHTYVHIRLASFGGAC